jgi:mRNA-degrading endonuclease toxin of MazEF toxin-antitoxin module
MAYVGPIQRWELYWAYLEPTLGSEQSGSSRPVLVVSNDRANAAFRVVTVLPLTKLEGKDRPPRVFEVPLPPHLLRNAFTPLALPHQIRTIAKERLLERVGLMDDFDARYRVEAGILDHLGIEFEEPL